MTHDERCEGLAARLMALHQFKWALGMPVEHTSETYDGYIQKGKPRKLVLQEYELPLVISYERQRQLAITGQVIPTAPPHTHIIVGHQDGKYSKRLGWTKL